MEIRNSRESQDAAILQQLEQETSTFVSSLDILRQENGDTALEKITSMQGAANRLYDLMNNLYQLHTRAFADEKPWQETMQHIDSAVYTVMQFAKTSEDQEVTSELLPICKTMLEVHQVATRLQLDML